MSKLKRPMHRTVVVTSIEVYSGEVFIGTGLSFWDGENLYTDIVDLFGRLLPPDWYTIRLSGEPQLAVLAETVQ